MISLARRYSLAFNAALLDNEKQEAIEQIRTFCQFYKDSKFVLIIKSPLFSTEQKQDLLLKDVKLHPKAYNFIRLLIDYERLELLPLILEQIEQENSVKLSTFKASVESGVELGKAKIEELKALLEKKLDLELLLEAHNAGYEGVKVEIKDLGLRVDFSENNIKQNLLSYILKGI